MKRFFSIFVVCFCWLLMSCGPNANVEFSLNVDGDFDVGKGVKIDLVADANNVPASVFETNAVYSKLTKNDIEPYSWLLHEIKDPIIRQIPNGGKYDIKVVGYVSWNGLKFEVNEHWKN